MLAKLRARFSRHPAGAFVATLRPLQHVSPPSGAESQVTAMPDTYPLHIAIDSISGRKYATPKHFRYREARVALSPMEVLRKVPLFSGLGEADLAAFADLTRERSYPKGSVIVFEDDPGDALFLVAAGQVKVVLIAEDGREVIISVLGEGSFFGEMAVIDEEPRSAHVIAMEDSSLLVLRREDFHARLRHSPEVAISLLKEISRRLRRADEKIGSLVLLDVNGRVAHLLLRMADDEG